MRSPIMPFNRDEGLIELIAISYHRLAEGMRARISTHGLSPIELRILAALSQRDGVPLTELVWHLGIKQPTLTKAIDRLQRARLVLRRTPSEDRRRTLIELTERGQDVARPMRQDIRAYEASLGRALGPGALDNLKRELEALVTLMRQMPRWAMRDAGDTIALLPARRRGRR